MNHPSDSAREVGIHNSSPLELPAWVAFNRLRWGLGARSVRETVDGAVARAIFYSDRQGRIVQPPTNAYLPVLVDFDERTSRRESAWLDAGDRIARAMRKQHLHGSVVLPPAITDVRPWQWQGFVASIVYTYIVRLPLDGTLVSRSARRRAAKAVELGLTCEITDDAEAVSACLSDSERRQGFSYGISSDHLRAALRQVGPSALRMYLCRDADGNAAASRVILHAPLGTAVDWLAGTADSQLSTGATQRLIQFALEDLGRVGATAFDFAGANLSTVAKAKSHWGGELVPAYSIHEPGPRSIARAGRAWWRFVRDANVS